MSLKGIILNKGDYIVSTSEIIITMVGGVPPEIIPTGSIFEVITVKSWKDAGSKYYIEDLKCITGTHNISTWILYNFHIDSFEKYNRGTNLKFLLDE